MSSAHGGQTLLSLTTQDLLQNDLPNGVSLLNMGARRLKDWNRPEQIFQLVIEGLPSEFPPLRALGASRHNLPAPTTSFIERDKEKAEVKQAMSAQRLITLTGSGGTGKTRLSLQVAANLLDQFADSVWFVELAPLTDPSLIPQTILSVLEVSEPQDKTITPDQAALRMLVSFLAALLLSAVLTFGGARRLNWTPGWIFVTAWIVPKLVFLILLRLRDPDLLVEPATRHKNAQPYERIIMPLYFLLAFTTFIIASLDGDLFRWSGEASIIWLVASYVIYLSGKPLAASQVFPKDAASRCFPAGKLQKCGGV